MVLVRHFEPFFTDRGLPGFDPPDVVLPGSALKGRRHVGQHAVSYVARPPGRLVRVEVLAGVEGGAVAMPDLSRDLPADHTLQVEVTEYDPGTELETNRYLLVCSPPRFQCRSWAAATSLVDEFLGAAAAGECRFVESNAWRFGVRSMWVAAGGELPPPHPTPPTTMFGSARLGRLDPDGVEFVYRAARGKSTYLIGVTRYALDPAHAGNVIRAPLSAPPADGEFYSVRVLVYVDGELHTGYMAECTCYDCADSESTTTHARPRHADTVGGVVDSLYEGMGLVAAVE
jgi:hypothetical protein